uniref:Uncharacterized protein n=1 Tax=Candidatus Nitrotoga fabula TaxID=2182327 RepID=A0A2X0SAM4_9PROT|nr:protein of unknown function [Candidatus Nitrotoga fabula]
MAKIGGLSGCSSVLVSFLVLYNYNFVSVNGCRALGKSNLSFKDTDFFCIVNREFVCFQMHRLVTVGAFSMADRHVTDQCDEEQGGLLKDFSAHVGF